jgi:hypothetical protein
LNSGFLPKFNNKPTSIFVAGNPPFFVKVFTITQPQTRLPDGGQVCADHRRYFFFYDN